VLLANERVEFMRPVFSCNYLVQGSGCAREKE
jgi:hypothetical protein